MSKNGFETALDQMKTVLKVTTNQKVTIDARKEAAEYFVSQLRPLLPKSKISKDHMRDQLEVIVEKDVVKVIFGEKAFYWYMVENGHAIKNKPNGKSYGRVRGTHTIRKIINKEKDNLERIMLEEITNKL